jgi:hypothetical protein
MNRARADGRASKSSSSAPLHGGTHRYASASVNGDSALAAEEECLTHYNSSSLQSPNGLGGIHRRYLREHTFAYVVLAATVLVFCSGGFLLSMYLLDDNSSLGVDGWLGITGGSPFESISSVSETISTSTNDDVNSFGIIYYNEYTRVKPLSGNYPWDNVFEPFRTTTFEINYNENVLSKSDAFTNDDVYYEWYVDGYHHTTGPMALVTFTDEPGIQHEISLKQRLLSTGEYVGAAVSLTGIVKYVRREIRTLIDQDREAFFQAISIMQRVPTAVGQKVYGSKYRSRDFLNRIHLYWGGVTDCDHWHQGPGFATSHITYSRVFEQSLQSIYPSVSLPYWDFTLESTFYGPDTFRQSGVFSDDWFGDAVCDNDLHTPITGRFAGKHRARCLYKRRDDDL